VISGRSKTPVQKFDLSEDELARRRAAAEKAEADKKANLLHEFNEKLDDQNAIIAAENDLLAARADMDEAEIDFMETRLEILKHSKKIQEEMGVAEDVVVAALKAQNEERQRGARAAREIAQAAGHKDAMTDLNISRLRAAGRGRQADKLEDDREVRRMVKSGERTEADARIEVNEARKQANDADTLSRFGRRKIYGRGRTGDGGLSSAGNSVRSDGGMRSDATGIDGFRKGRWRIDEAADGPLNGVSGSALNPGGQTRHTPKTDAGRPAARSSVGQHQARQPDVVAAVNSAKTVLQDIAEGIKRFFARPTERH
jgi:hypothetical protein